MKHWNLIPLLGSMIFFSACNSDADDRPRNTGSGVMLIINGDDVGITKEYTDASLEAYFSGSITSVSVFSPGKDAERALSLLKNHPEYGAGVHLTLTGNVPPLTKGSTLQQKNGNMWNSAEEAAARVLPEEAKAEWDAQIRKVMDAGITVTHLDGHMGCYFQTPDLFAAAVALSRTYRIPLISPYIPAYMPGKQRDYLPVTTYSGIYNLPNGREETPENRRSAYLKLLSSLAPGIHYVFTHQGKAAEDGSIYGDMPLRLNDSLFWRSEETREYLKEEGYRLLSSGEFKKMYMSGSI